jgi:hypothetical protein
MPNLSDSGMIAPVLGEHPEISLERIMIYLPDG